MVFTKEYKTADNYIERFVYKNGSVWLEILNLVLRNMLEKMRHNSF